MSHPRDYVPPLGQLRLVERMLLTLNVQKAYLPRGKPVRMLLDGWSIEHVAGRGWAVMEADAHRSMQSTLEEGILFVLRVDPNARLEHLCYDIPKTRAGSNEERDSVSRKELEALANAGDRDAQQAIIPENDGTDPDMPVPPYAGDL